MWNYEIAYVMAQIFNQLILAKMSFHDPSQFYIYCLYKKTARFKDRYKVEENALVFWKPQNVSNYLHSNYFSLEKNGWGECLRLIPFVIDTFFSVTFFSDTFCNWYLFKWCLLWWYFLRWFIPFVVPPLFFVSNPLMMHRFVSHFLSILSNVIQTIFKNSKN